jgi:hypothetical protein
MFLKVFPMKLEGCKDILNCFICLAKSRACVFERDCPLRSKYYSDNLMLVQFLWHQRTFPGHLLIFSGVKNIKTDTTTPPFLCTARDIHFMFHFSLF